MRVGLEEKRLYYRGTSLIRNTHPPRITIPDVVIGGDGRAPVAETLVIWRVDFLVPCVLDHLREHRGLDW